MTECKDCFHFQLCAYATHDLPVCHSFVADVVSCETLKQVMWERDTAIEQLKSYGVGFGEEADVVKVVRCKNCRFLIDRDDGSHGCYRHFLDECELDDFCSYGERSDRQ